MSRVIHAHGQFPLVNPTVHLSIDAPPEQNKAAKAAQDESKHSEAGHTIKAQDAHKISPEAAEGSPSASSNGQDNAQVKPKDTGPETEAHGANCKRNGEYEGLNLKSVETELYPDSLAAQFRNNSREGGFYDNKDMDAITRLAAPRQRDVESVAAGLHCAEEQTEPLLDSISPKNHIIPMTRAVGKLRSDLAYFQDLSQGVLMPTIPLIQWHCEELLSALRSCNEIIAQTNTITQKEGWFFNAPSS
ncbi:hypothetical protein RJ55_06797 [Drechmeria coniospora]|nr:hypothetical protein RJ55_06797 [Drechmeria coniospora]